MTIKVTVNIVPNEQFGLGVEPAVEDQQLQLPNLPVDMRQNQVLPGREVALEISPIEDALPLSYGVPLQTGLVPA